MPEFCPNVVAHGRCDLEHCRGEHHIRKCECGKWILHQNYDAHVAGQRHLKEMRRLRGRAGDVGEPQRCEVCVLDFPNALDYDDHTRSQAHREAVASPAVGGPAPTPHITVTGTPVPGAPNYLKCSVCHANVLDGGVWNSHRARHEGVALMARFTAAVAASERDRNGIEVSYKNGIDFGVLDLEEVLLSTADVRIKATAEDVDVGLLSVKLTSAEHGEPEAVKFAAGIRQGSKKISHNRATIVEVWSKASYQGRCEATLELIFLDRTRGEQFVITRRILAVVGSREHQELLKATAPYVRPKPSRHDQPKNIVSVDRPKKRRVRWAVPLPRFLDPPRDAIVAAAFGRNPSAAIRPFIPVFDLDHYPDFWQALLWIEERKMQLDLDAYAMSDVNLVPERHGYRLQIQGLDEGRPSLIVGDFILVQHSGNMSGTWYEGHVEEITGISIFVRFDGTFRALQGSRADVRFQLNRLPDRRMHQAVTSEIMRAEVLFPTAELLGDLHHPTAQEISSIGIVDRKLSQNPEQLEAVAAILHRPLGSVPFVLFGPPGTGKTYTLVKAIEALLKHDPKIKILACAPSNSAADLIAIGLAQTMNKTGLFRLNAFSRSYTALPPALRDYSLCDDHRDFTIPPRAQLESYRVVVSTCISAGIPYAIGIKPGHFSHVFIDEAGQATEPMAMIPIKTMATDKTNIVLAGDSKQLNPITHSPLARGLGLGKSYLERLMNLPMYDEHAGKGITIMKLVKHFRSHPDILHFPNQQFYSGELIPCADVAITHSLLNFEGLVTPGFPLVFHGIVGKDQREAASPSFFNIDEVTLVIKYAMDLVGNRRLGVVPSRDIGIITPYHAQTQKIRRALPRELQGTKVGSVEEFQGQERRIIIISTVRSSTDFVEYDLQRMLGFVANPRRFNVAVTRAQALLVVIGNPQTLSLDHMWRAWLNFVHQRGGWRGKEITWNPNEDVNENGRYDEQARIQAGFDVDEMMNRIRAKIIDNDDAWAIWETEIGAEGDNTAVEYRGREVD